MLTVCGETKNSVTYLMIIYIIYNILYHVFQIKSMCVVYNVI